jgi:hypothetical protein
MKCTVEGRTQSNCNVGESFNLTNMNISFALKQYELPDPHFSEALGYSALGKALNGSKYENFLELVKGSDLNNVISFVSPDLLNSE